MSAALIWNSNNHKHHHNNGLIINLSQPMQHTSDLFLLLLHQSALFVQILLQHGVCLELRINVRLKRLQRDCRLPELALKVVVLLLKFLDCSRALPKQEIFTDTVLGRRINKKVVARTAAISFLALSS